MDKDISLAFFVVYVIRTHYKVMDRYIMPGVFQHSL